MHVIIIQRIGTSFTSASRFEGRRRRIPFLIFFFYQAPKKALTVREKVASRLIFCPARREAKESHCRHSKRFFFLLPIHHHSLAHKLSFAMHQQACTSPLLTTVSKTEFENVKRETTAPNRMSCCDLLQVARRVIVKIHLRVQLYRQVHNRVYKHARSLR